MLCNLCYAFYAMQSMLCTRHYAIYAMQSMRCNLCYALSIYLPVAHLFAIDAHLFAHLSDALSKPLTISARAPQSAL